jgi:heavy metal sensor kinase
MKTLSIRLRLTIWYFAVLAVVLSLFGVTAYFAMRNSIHRTMDEELRARMEGVRRLIERTAQEGGEEDLQYELREHSELRAGGALLQVSDTQGKWLYRSASMNRYEIPRPETGPPGPFTFVVKDSPLRVLSEEVRAGNKFYIVQVAADLGDFYDALHRFGMLLLVSIPIFLMCATAGGYWMSRRALAPVDQITQTARNISVQNLSSRLVVPQTHDELQRLSETLNGMLERLEAAFKKIVQFTADASHELRTPVAVMRTRAELSLRKARSADEYRDTVAQIHSELENTSDLIERLMLLARADSGAETLQLTRVNVTEIVREACDQGSALAEAKHVVFREQVLDHPVWIRGDSHSLRRLFLILIDNAVKYTPPNGHVEVSLQEINGCVVGEVRDTGIGIGADDLPNVFERFYRADKARSRELGGVGLGLSIGRWIAEAHAGTIEVQSSLGSGSVFQVRLPLADGDS